jgi:tetratricopeptide (TPR) repeat protein
MCGSEELEKDNPIKLHKEGAALADKSKFEEASEKYVQASELYEKVENFFDASYAMFEAAGCNYQLKDYGKAKERFLRSADLAFKKGYDCFAVSALEYVVDCHRALGEEDQADELEQKIKEKKSGFKR